MAQKVYVKYFSPSSEYEVNVDDEVRIALQKDMANPTLHCFDAAQEFVRHLLETDSLPKFTRSEYWKQYLEEKKKNPRDGEGTCFKARP